MTYAKNSTITAIHRPITNGMYNDTYTVIYSNGIRRNYTIKGAMNKKHFEFIQSATVESKYSKHTGRHTADIFTAPAEPKEEPTTEEQAAEEPTTTDTPANNNEEVNSMRTYTAYVTDKNSKQSYFVTADYSNKKAFAEDLRRNGYAVHYIATPYTIDAVSDSYNKRREYRNEVARNTRAAVKAHSETTAEEPAEVQTAEVQATEEQKNYYAETYNFGFIAHNSEYGAPSLLIFSSKEDREKYINKYDIYRGDVNKRVIAITAKEARKYYERTRDGVRGWKDGTEYIKHIRDNIYYSVESGDYGRTSEEFTL